ncbi:UDP-N-acetylglucosamine 2-epimerase (non-hydrolysing) [Parapedobacter composti]|uniref:UDP-N-acetylglucosamine 2-epimerase (non-hydrolyzing) n=1 Tax=Parapedobacter composti TaxID=623281 RepID=A0A1I1MLK7_9SPHI|nr:UDP-N-acetylglucosamine 2-epimerase (non-hydrolyzing) [Parapedobacter composti]SFC86251.1 UDP-N-acetylglucosamine 2-epimerase (non-hydrolysing) [Parapedobacter composti]
MKTKHLIVFGTRPEAIKMAPLVKVFNNHSEDFDIRVCVTAQHREMLDQVLNFFEIHPDYDLNIMKPDQNLFTLTANIITGMKPILDEYMPDYVYVHGDTTTSMAVALACFYAGIKVCHVEAGLRTYNKLSPFPEELNRQLTGRIADFHFAPTSISKDNLLKERIPEESIVVTGNTVIDALFYSVRRVEYIESAEIDHLKSVINTDKELILVTGHRRENHGSGFVNICNALKEIVRTQNVQIIYPVHLNPNVKGPVYDILGNEPNIHLIAPLSYPAFVWLMNRSKLIITDSGGVQEEAPSLGKPVLVMRNTTERPEAVEAGTVILVGTDKRKIVEECSQLLTNPTRYQAMRTLHNPYGDGKACERIVSFIANQASSIVKN